MRPEHIVWSKQFFRMLNEGGTWAVPDGGLVFTKREGSLVLVDAMPWVPILMGRTQREWFAYQEEQFQTIKEHFEAAGVPVVAEFKIGEAQ
jgi:hypothetical protein